MNSLASGLAQPAPSEVRFSGSVCSRPRFFYGTRTHAMHETFGVRSDDGPRIAVVDNVALAPRAPVLVGDRITIQGELIPGARGGPLVHWTHHDPQHHHVDGFIEWHGRRYG